MEYLCNVTSSGLACPKQRDAANRIPLDPQPSSPTATQELDWTSSKPEQQERLPETLLSRPIIFPLHLHCYNVAQAESLFLGNAV